MLPQQFQSTPSVWRETAIAMQSAMDNAFQSTPSVWRETYRGVNLAAIKDISIHSLRVEGDAGHRPNHKHDTISIHSLRVEGDPEMQSMCRISRYFNPLPPCGGRRVDRRVFQHCRAFQSTPSVWRETTSCQSRRMPAEIISIHSLRVEGDITCDIFAISQTKFQSTPSVWRETFCLPVAAVATIFQSTPSVWRETRGIQQKGKRK